MPEAVGKAISVPGFLMRARQSVRYTISGIRPDTWMSPLQPIMPMEPVTPARQYDFPVGRNLFYTPRGTECFSFATLRAVARQSELVRLAIETRQDQVSSIKWKVKPILENEGTDDEDPRIKTIEEFFRSPDKIHDWDQWVRMLLEELFVTDAVALYRRKDRGGNLYALEPIDGTTLFPLIDGNGRTPIPPDPAYQQILKGVPKADWTSEEMIYYPRKTTVNTPYGYPVVEQVLESARTDIQRLKYTLAYFTEGSVPDAYITAPDGMNADKVLAFETHLNALLAGNANGRRQMPVLLNGMEVKSLKQADLKNDFDEWLARKICFAFSLPPTAFVRQLNRSTAQSDQERAKDEGLYPVLLYIKRLIDRIIREDFESPDLEIQPDTTEEKDPKTQADIDKVYVDAGIMTRNEIRDALGLEDIEGGDEPLVTAGQALLPLPGSPLYEQQQKEQQEQAQRELDAHTAASQSDNGQGDDKVVPISTSKKPVKKKLYGYGASVSR